MRGLALCLVAGALLVAGCGSGNSNSNAPTSQQAATSGGSAGQPVAVAALGRATPASLCTPEGKGKPKKQCTAGLTKLNKGKAKNPASACKGLSKKKTKGVRGKSPYAVCVKGAATLMAAKNRKTGNGAADSNSSSAGNSSSDSTDSTDSTDSANTSDQLVCTDANGDQVPPDDPSVEDCTDAADATATDSSSDSTDGTGSTDGTDTTDTSGDSGN